MNEGEAIGFDAYKEAWLEDVLDGNPSTAELG